jgi:hypothetical protein
MINLSNIEGALFFSVTLNLIVTIVFLFMASNISKIKKLIEHKETNINYSQCFTIGELKEFQGKKEEALDAYMEALFYVNRFLAKNPTQQELKNKETIKGKIIALGGKAPD